MGGDKRFGSMRRFKSHGLIFAFACVALLAGGCSKSEPDKADNGATFDSSRLPRVSGAKEVFASPATTIFTSPDSVAQTADTLDKALAAGGWQKYVAPNTAYSQDPKIRTMSLKKGPQALSVFITVAPAQNNATSVQYAALPLKTDLPFTKDASAVEYAPDRPLLTLITAKPVDKTLDFYRKELGARGWALWSEKTNGKQPAGGPSGVAHERGGYAHYVNDKEPAVALVLTLQKAEGGKYKVELKEWPVGILASLHKAYLNGGPNSASALVDVGKLTPIAKAGIMPKAGQVKVLFGNINPVEAAITFNGKTLKVAAGAGTMNPGGPSLDVAPGKYKYSIKLPGGPAQSDEVEVGADETWGLMIGPGGVLALQAY